MTPPRPMARARPPRHVDSSEKQLATITAQPAKDDSALKQVEQLATDIDAAAKMADADAAKAEAAAKAAADAAGATPSADAAALVASAKTAATEARAAATEGTARRRPPTSSRTSSRRPRPSIRRCSCPPPSRDRDRRSAQRASRSREGAEGDRREGGQHRLLVRAALRQDGRARKRSGGEEEAARAGEGVLEAFARTGCGARVSAPPERAAELVDDIKELGAQ